MVRFGIIGAGKIARKFAADLKHVRKAELVAIGSRNKEKAQEFAQEFGAEKAFGSYQELAAAPGIDVVYVATPHHLHHANTMLCLNHNKAVLCEKPLGVNTAQVEEVIALARQKNIPLMEALWTYTLPVIEQVRQRVKYKTPGELKLIRASFGFPSQLSPQSRLHNPNLAGGALLDLGIYPIALCTLMTDSFPDTIQAQGFIGQTGVDDYTAITLKYPDHTIAQLLCSVRTQLQNTAFLFGTRQKIEIPEFWRAEESRTWYNENERTPENDPDREIPGGMISRVERETFGYNYEAAEMCRLVEQQKAESYIVPWQKTLQNTQIMDEVRRQIGLKYPFE